MINSIKKLIGRIREELSFAQFMKDIKLERGNIMPEYDYQCSNCGVITRVSKSMSDDTTPICKNCGNSEVTRLYKPVHMKGCGSSGGGCGGGCGGGSCGGCG